MTGGDPLRFGTLFPAEVELGPRFWFLVLFLSSVSLDTADTNTKERERDGFKGSVHTTLTTAFSGLLEWRAAGSAGYWTNRSLAT